MLKALQRWWRYVATLVGVKLEETADPKVQLEQAIAESRDQHLRLTDSATAVIANQMHLQMRLDRALDDYERTTQSTKQALVLADEAGRDGKDTRATSFAQAAEAYANRMIGLERDVDALRAQVEAAAQASGEARHAVKLNAVALQKTLGNRERLLDQLDQAKMQEQINAAMSQLRDSVGQETPTLEDVRAKVERRLVAARARSDLSGATVETGMLEVEQAQVDAEAQGRLQELRAQLGIGPGSKVSVTKVAPAALEAGDVGSQA